MALREGIVDMYEATFGAFNVVKSERIRHAAELKVIRIVERSRVESNDSVPAALHRYRVARNYGVAGSLGSEVWKCRCYSFVSITIAQREGIVVAR